MIQVYTGNGKGKTTAALGLALRAAGAGLKVYIAQFAKGRACSELVALKKFKNVKAEQFGSCRFIRKISQQDKNSAKKGLQKVRSVLKSKKFSLVILDEINVSLNLGLLQLNDVLELIQKTPAATELILTGRNACKEIVELADLVSEIKDVKHYFEKGVTARKGIEY
ncbi:MAG: cob(I)yrinic acid a,c-diamide adenosyltransferase [Candidatus Omnitrophica bacterium]|nr:cob(I)yrinic acid a,c-diamide adenosyltransferase [Candidatus Omnitrophota bacterium]MDD5653904.1 cob(I)yrinic acid a,c-diamide adenosyltransferase [Candidatus Omnitrophota bacterium]